MTNAVYNGVYYGIALWSMVPGPYPRITAEKLSNAFGWTVTYVWNAIRGPQPISETTVTTISDLATRVKGWPVLNTTGEKIDAFINSKSSTNSQKETTLEAIVDAAKTATFPYSKESTRINTFKTAVRGILNSNAATLSWSELYGFGARTILQPGLIWIPRACVLYYSLGWIQSDNSWVWGTTALAGLGGYSYLLHRYAGPELSEAHNSSTKIKLQPLKEKVIELIKTQAMSDFSMTTNQGTPDAMYSDNLTTFVKELKAIGQNKIEPQQVPSSTQTQVAPQQVQTGNGDRKTATTPVKSKTSQVAPLASSMASKSKIEVQAPAYTSLNRAKIIQWSNKITTDLQFQDPSPEDAIVFLKDQLSVVIGYLEKAVNSENELFEEMLREFRTEIKNHITQYQSQIDDAQAAARRSSVARRLDRSFDAEVPTESVLSWLMRCCGRWKKPETPLVAAHVAPSVVQGQEPQSPARRQQEAPPQRTPDQSDIYGNITISPDRTTNNLVATPNFTPIQRQDQGQGQQQRNF